MADPLVVLAVVSNLAIAFAYLGIGVYVTPKFSVTASSHGSRLARLTGLVFFVTCAITHLELAAHAAGTEPDTADAQAEWLTSWHGLVVHTVQGVAGLGFLALAARYLQIRIYNKEYYERVLDERIRDIEERLDATS